MFYGIKPGARSEGPSRILCEGKNYFLNLQSCAYKMSKLFLMDSSIHYKMYINNHKKKGT